MSETLSKRNVGIDAYRVFVLLLVIVYHLWVCNGAVSINNIFLNSIVSLGGEVGVTGFFVLSGWSIYGVLNRKKEKYSSFIKNRFFRIAPEYYLSVMIVVFFTSGAGWLSKEGIPSIIATLLFVQNSIPNLAAVNGVLWTMSVTVMFYLIAPFIYKLFLKFGLYITIVAIILTIFMKYIFLHYGSLIVVDNSFYLSRQTILTDLDNFVLGMTIAYLNQKGIDKFFTDNFRNVVGLLCSFGGIVIYGIIGKNYGIHTDNLSGYTWHSIIAILMALNLYYWGSIKISNYENFSIKIISFFSKHQYGIYIFHLLVIQNLIANSGLIYSLNEWNYYIAQILLFIVSITVGVALSLVVKLSVIGYRCK